LPELSHQILYGVPVPPSSICNEPVDPDLEKVILRLLDKSLQERVASADELVRSLGFDGKPEEVLSDIRSRERKAAPRDTIDRQLSRTIVRRKWLLGFVLALYLLPSGPITTAILLGALWLFFKGQTERRWSRRHGMAALGMALFLLALFAGASRAGEWSIWISLVFGTQYSTAIPSAMASLANKLHLGDISQFVILIVLGAAGIIQFFLPAAAAGVYVRLRRVQREKSLRDATLEGATGSERYLEMLRDSLDYRFADVGFHLKYAEALVARGRHADAAVEARLILVQDPYHFNGNLLLANLYYTLGLYDDSAAVCERYLNVSGYCFEFAEMLQQCEGRIAAP
jgi:hypothetical protein